MKCHSNNKVKINKREFNVVSAMSPARLLAEDGDNVFSPQTLTRLSRGFIRAYQCYELICLCSSAVRQSLKAATHGNSGQTGGEGMRVVSYVFTHYKPHAFGSGQATDSMCGGFYSDTIIIINGLYCHTHHQANTSFVPPNPFYEIENQSLKNKNKITLF